MRDATTISLSMSTPIREAIHVIDNGSLQIALVVDEDKKLLGTITDGDIRRSILKGLELDDTVDKIMHRGPATAFVTTVREEILALMQFKQVQQIPILDLQGHVVGLELLNDLITPDKKTNSVVIMAGGLGSRLRPLTDDCPKPLLKIGDKPILETIVENFIECGFSNFYFSVNYRADMVEDYFGNGAKWNINIEYLREDKRMGTAGSLSMLPKDIKDPVLIMNGDLLTKVNFQHLLDFHTENQAAATMCVREYNFQVPYGVVKIEDNRLLNVDEKPAQRFFVNAGIYVLDPGVLEHVPKDEYFDMPDLFNSLVESGKASVAFPIREYWLDIGHVDDFERANGEYGEVFNELGST